MATEQPPGADRPEFAPGDTTIFLGDHTSPDSPGYVRLASEVIARFRPELNLNFISAGSPGQTARALRSQALLDLLTSSHPGWVIIGIGLADVLRDSETIRLTRSYQQRMSRADPGVESALGPEHQVRRERLGPMEDVGPEPQLVLVSLKDFEVNLRTALEAIQSAGISPALLTTVLVGSDLQHPLNHALRAYNRTIRNVAAELQVPVVDIERAFRDVLDRAANYKQQVALAGTDGAVNAQGQALMARTFLGTFGLLPQQGMRPGPR